MKFITIKENSTGVYKEKGSKFLAYAYSVTTEDEIKQKLAELRKEHHGARHFCYAYRINPENITYRANDDGEPNHTAGTPILGQIVSRELVNVLVVVVRYFGGTKLGASGLIQAYKAAANDSLHNAILIESEVVVELKIAFNYQKMDAVMKILKHENAQIIDQTSDLRAHITLTINKTAFAELKSQLSDVDELIFGA